MQTNKKFVRKKRRPIDTLKRSSRADGLFRGERDVRERPGGRGRNYG
jgi:hypothetical protein